MNNATKFSSEVRERAVRMAQEVRSDYSVMRRAHCGEVQVRSSGATHPAAAGR